MELIVPGTLAHIEEIHPDKEKKQDFAPHNMLSISQINRGKMEAVYIKDEELTRVYPKIGTPVQVATNMTHWQRGGNSGDSFRFVQFIEPSMVKKVVIDGNSLIIIEFISGVPGADMFNFFFSLVSGGCLMAFVPIACMKLIQRA